MLARFSALAVFLVLVGCGYGPEYSPADPNSSDPSDSSPNSTSARAIVLTNDYAESLFTVTIVEHPSERARTIFSDKRLGIFEDATAEGAISAASTSVTINATTTSLGTVHRFGPMELKLATPGDVGLIYDYDLATARFQMKYGID